MNNQIDSIYDLSFEELKAYLGSLDIKPYRAKQIWDFIYKKSVNEPDLFTNLALTLRTLLKENFSFESLEVSRKISSTDGATEKFLFHLKDETYIEAVIMKYTRGNTLCISSQVGCAMGCTFCATGQMGFSRNLSSGEIVEQVVALKKILAEDDEMVTNIVFMGMGEPFHNYDQVMKSISTMNDENGMMIGARRFTISTAGVVPKIKQFADEGTQINLAVSLHAATDDLRSSMMPINKRYPIEDLIAACFYYTKQTSRRITFEWALINQVNDTKDQAERLSSLLKGMLCHVNIIPLNPTENFSGKRSQPERVENFSAMLEDAGIPCSVRVRRGIDIDAGCGQLATKYLPDTN